MTAPLYRIEAGDKDGAFAVRSCKEWSEAIDYAFAFAARHRAALVVVTNTNEADLYFDGLTDGQRDEVADAIRRGREAT